MNAKDGASMSKLFEFPGLAGIITGACLFVLPLSVLRLFILKADFYDMDAKGKAGTFDPRLANYLDIAKFVLGLASGSVVLLVGSTTFHEGGPHLLPTSYASPLYLLVISVICGIFFMMLETLDYEAYQHNPKSYTGFKYSRNIALGIGFLLCFLSGYAWLTVIATAHP
jgi:heme/copper-type cytochrome/quinol oxidase subunit 3